MDKEEDENEMNRVGESALLIDERDEESPLVAKETKERKFFKDFKWNLCLYVVLIVSVCCLGLILMFVGLVFLIKYLIDVTKIPTNPLERAKYWAKRVPLIDGHNDLGERLLGFKNKGYLDKFHLDRRLSPEEQSILSLHNTTLQTDIPRMKEGYIELITATRDGLIHAVIQQVFLIFHIHTKTIGEVHNGLTDFGKKVIAEMNKLGIIVDISHASNKTMGDVLDVTQSPVMFSHSNAFSLCHSKRNVPDDILLRLQENNGIIMVTFCTPFVSEEQRLIQEEYSKKYSGYTYYNKMIEWQNENPKLRASVGKVADHIDYIKKLHGSTRHIGVGSDFDGISLSPLGLEDTSKEIYLIAELISRHYDDDEIKQILGENLIRVWKDVTIQADKLGLDTYFEL